MQSTLLSGPAYEDCMTLKRSFMQKKSVSFEDFKGTWHKVAFHSLHDLISEKNGCRVPILIDSIFLTGLKWLTATPTSQLPALPTSSSATNGDQTTPSLVPAEVCEKVVGLYLLWSVFYTQIIKPHIMIRTTPDSWSEICEFHAYLTNNKLEEADFMLCQLKADSAFLICYSEVPNCVPNSVIISRVPKRELLGNCLPSSLPTSTASSNSLTTYLTSSLQPCELEYAQKKQKLSSILPSHLLHDSTLTVDLQKLMNSSEQV